MSATVRSIVLGIAMASLTSGCGRGDGPQLATVTGTVIMNGQPLAGVNVTFIPRDKGSPSYGGTDKHGEFRLMFNQQRAGAELGKHDVLIEVRDPETDDSGNPVSTHAPPAIPARYGHPGALTAEVVAGSNEFDFTIDGTVTR